MSTKHATVDNKWSPLSDKTIPKPYSADKQKENKAKNGSLFMDYQIQPLKMAYIKYIKVTNLY